MRRNFYLVMKAMSQLAELSPEQIIEIIYPDSDIKEHLALKLFTYMRTDNVNAGLLNFYEGIDGAHQYMFDTWLNQQIEAIELKTTPYHANLGIKWGLSPTSLIIELPDGVNETDLSRACYNHNCAVKKVKDNCYQIKTIDKFNFFRLGAELGEISLQRNIPGNNS